MPRIKFQTGEFFHVYNRGSDKRQVFFEDSDYFRFLESLKLFNTVAPILSLRQQKRLKSAGIQFLQNDCPLVEILAYCLLPNHYHLILKQIAENGVSKFMQRIGVGYTNFFNLKNDRSGVLFQGRFKAVKVVNEGHLQYLSGYVHGNPESHGIAKADEWKWSSLSDYVGKTKYRICNPKIILSQFSSIEEYKNLLKQIIKNAISVKEALE